MLLRTYPWLAFAGAVAAGCVLPEATRGDDVATGGGGGSTAITGTVGAGGAGGSTATVGAGGAGGGGGGVIGPVMLAATSAVVAATGMAQQTHIVFADDRYRLFYLDGTYPQQVRIRSSSDFVTWTDTMALPLTVDHGLEGRNLAVAHNPLNDHVHLTLSYTETAIRSRLHARAAFTGDAVTFVSSVVVHGVTAPAPDLAVDAPFVGVTSVGRPFGMSGYHDDGASAAPGSSFVWWADTLDVGEVWPNNWTDPPLVLETQPAAVHSRAAAGGMNDDAIVFWEQVDSGPYGSNVHYAFSGPSMPNAALNAFQPSSGQQHPNDWNVVAVTATEVHIARQALGTMSLQHRIFTPMTSFADGPSIEEIDLGEGRGLFLATDGDGVLLAGIRNDNAIVVARWSRGAGLPGSWGPWTEITTTGVKRTFLGGNRVAVDGRAALIWTEGDAPSLQIVGALVPVAPP